MEDPEALGVVLHDLAHVDCVEGLVDELPDVRALPVPERPEKLARDVAPAEDTLVVVALVHLDCVVVDVLDEEVGALDFRAEDLHTEAIFLPVELRADVFVLLQREEVRVGVVVRFGGERREVGVACFEDDFFFLGLLEFLELPQRGNYQVYFVLQTNVVKLFFCFCVQNVVFRQKTFVFFFEDLRNEVLLFLFLRFYVQGKVRLVERS